MRRLRNHGATLCAAALTAAVAGCGTTASPDTTLQQLLDASGLGGTTLGDLFDSASGLLGGFGPQLTDDQRSQLEALQASLDAGAITPEEFDQQALAIIGESAGFGPFGGAGFGGRGPGGHGMGGPGMGGHSLGGAFPGGPGMGGRPGNPAEFLTELLSLSDEQNATAESIFESARTDSEVLFEDARMQIDAVLTDEQRALLPEPPDNAPLGPPPGFGGHPGGMGGHSRPFGGGDPLNLTDEQKAEIDAIHAALHDAVEARHQQAQDELRAILTEEQIAALDEFEADHPRPHGNDM